MEHTPLTDPTLGGNSFAVFSTPTPQGMSADVRQREGMAWDWCGHVGIFNDWTVW